MCLRLSLGLRVCCWKPSYSLGSFSNHHCLGLERKKKKEQQAKNKNKSKDSSSPGSEKATEVDPEEYEEEPEWDEDEIDGEPWDEEEEWDGWYGDEWCGWGETSSKKRWPGDLTWEYVASQDRVRQTLPHVSLVCFSWCRAYRHDGSATGQAGEKNAACCKPTWIEHSNARVSQLNMNFDRWYVFLGVFAGGVFIPTNLWWLSWWRNWLKNYLMAAQLGGNKMPHVVQVQSFCVTHMCCHQNYFSWFACRQESQQFEIWFPSCADSIIASFRSLAANQCPLMESKNACSYLIVILPFFWFIAIASQLSLEVLDLHNRFECGGDWGMERTFIQCLGGKAKLEEADACAILSVLCQQKRFAISPFLAYDYWKIPRPRFEVPAAPVACMCYFFLWASSTQIESRHLDGQPACSQGAWEICPTDWRPFASAAICSATSWHRSVHVWLRRGWAFLQDMGWGARRFLYASSIQTMSNKSSMLLLLGCCFGIRNYKLSGKTIRT